MMDSALLLVSIPGVRNTTTIGAASGGCQQREGRGMVARAVMISNVIFPSVHFENKMIMLELLS